MSYKGSLDIFTPDLVDYDSVATTHTSCRDYRDHKSITRMASFVIPIILIKNNINDVHPIGQMGSN